MLYCPNPPDMGCINPPEMIGGFLRNHWVYHGVPGLWLPFGDVTWLLKVAIDIICFPIDNMVISHSYVAVCQRVDLYVSTLFPFSHGSY